MTVTGATKAGYLSLYSIDDQRDQPYLLSSNLNYAAGETVANSVTVTVPYDGMISVYSSAGSPYAIIDVAGWYTDTAGYSDQKGGYHPLTPERLLDTRRGLGGTTLSEGVVRELQVGGVGGVPANAKAVVFSLTGLNANKATWMTAWPTGETAPVVSNLNLTTGQIVSNQVIVKLGTDGKVSLVNARGSLDAVADVTGWYDDGGADAATGFVYHAISPTRAIDTRNAPQQPLQGGVTRTYDLAALAGLPNVGVAAVTANVTITQPSAAGWLTVWPANGEGPPTASLLNFARAQTVPNLGSLTLHQNQANFAINTGTAHLLVDVTGWFGPPTPLA